MLCTSPVAARAVVAVMKPIIKQVVTRSHSLCRSIRPGMPTMSIPRNNNKKMAMR
jgi:hypothetical protein